jgi:hypothetical protein
MSLWMTRVLLTPCHPCRPPSQLLFGMTVGVLPCNRNSMLFRPIAHGNSCLVLLVQMSSLESGYSIINFDLMAHLIARPIGFFGVFTNTKASTMIRLSHRLSNRLQYMWFFILLRLANVLFISLMSRMPFCMDIFMN